MENKKEVKDQSEDPKLREIIIATDGNKINIVKADVAGTLEFRAILIALLENLK